MENNNIEFFCKKQKIDLNNIKVAIFDFDDTLAIHKDKDYIKHRNENEESLHNYYLNAYLNKSSFYDVIEPCDISNSIFKLISLLREKNVKIYCVSGMKFSFHLKAKEYFVHKYYGSDIEVISARNQELKIDAAKIISKINNCKLDEVLFVDDMEENIINFNKTGIIALLPNDVESLIYQK